MTAATAVGAGTGSPCSRKSFEVEGDRLAHLTLGVLDALTERHAPRQVGRPGAKAAVGGSFDDDQVAGRSGAGHSSAPSGQRWSPRRPACLRMLRCRPTGKSMPVLPGIVIC